MNPKNLSELPKIVGRRLTTKRIVPSVIRASCRAVSVILSLFWIQGVSAQLIRRANTTLTLPLEPVAANGQIVLTEAFPGITFQFPDCIRSVPGDTNKLFVIERYGRIMVIDDLANPQPRLFMDITDRVYATDWNPNRRTEGLTSIEFHPDFAHNHRFFVSYCGRTFTANGEEQVFNRLSEFRASDDGTIGLPDSEVPYITQIDFWDGHDINDLHFGTDGYLYVAVGDEGDGGKGDEGNNAQKIDKNFFSAIMRIDVNKRPGNLLPNPNPAGTTNYWVPADNPFVGATNFNGQPVDPAKVRTEFWAVGLRNPWRISFDPLTQVMYEGDVGQHTFEEINRIVKGGNYGWSFWEGTAPGPKASSKPPGFTSIDPLVEYSTGYDQSSGFSVTGGVVYRGSRIPSLYGSLLFADYVSGNLWALNVDQDPPGKPVWLLKQPGIASFGYDPRNGDVLIVYHNETEPGKIYRVDVSGGTSGSYPQTLADTGIFSELTTLTPNEGIVPYDVNLPFWSDGAIKSRWFSVPDPTKTIWFNSELNWRFPAPTVWIKHFDLETTPGDATTRTRVETRVLVKCTTGPGIYGLSYRWDDQGQNATLVSENGDNRLFAINDPTGPRQQTWHFPSRSECLACHTTAGGLALGFNTAQLNTAHMYDSLTTNQISALAAAGYLENPPNNLAGLRALAKSDDESVSRTYRVKSYLAANCSFCHQPGGSSLAAWDARTVTPLSFANIVNGVPHNNLGDASNRIIVAGSPDHSAMFRRISDSTQRMPPVGSNVLDKNAINLLQAWISQDLPQYELYAGWAQRVFASAPTTDSSPDADPDGDGLTNYEEYLAGSDPLSAASRFTVQPVVSSSGARFSMVQPANRALLIEGSGNLTEPYWEFLDSPDNSVSFPAKPLPRSILDLLNGREKYYRIRLLEP